MANVASLSKTQAEAISAWLEATMPDSLDELAEKIGADNAFRLVKMRKRLKDSAKS